MQYKFVMTETSPPFGRNAARGARLAWYALVVAALILTMFAVGMRSVAAQTGPQLQLSGSGLSGEHIAGQSFDINVRLAARPSNPNQIRVEIRWRQGTFELTGNPSATNIGYTRLHFNESNWDDDQTLTFSPNPENVSRAGTRNITFKAFELVPHTYEVCDQYYGETAADARAAGRCSMHTTVRKGPEYKDTKSIRVAPESPTITPSDVRYSGSGVRVTEGGTVDYTLTLSKRRGPGKTYTVTPRVVGTDAGITITPASHSWTAGSSNSVSFTVSAAEDDDIVDHDFNIVHDLSGNFATEHSSLSPQSLHVSGRVVDDDKDFGIMVKDQDGKAIDSSNPMKLPNRVSLSDDRDLYFTVQLENQASSILTFNTRSNESVTYTLLVNKPHDTDLSTDTPNLCSGIALNGVFYGSDGVPVCRMDHTYDEEPFKVSATNFAENRSSYHLSLVRFTQGNWDQPVKVYLRTTRDVAAGATGFLRFELRNGQGGAIPVELVDPTEIGLQAIKPPPRPVPDSEPSSGQADEEIPVVSSSDDGGQSVNPPAADPPLVKYADLIARIKTDLRSPNYGGEGHDLKRVLKTLGVPEYANYDGGEVGEQEAINRRTMPRDNPHWEGIAAAVAYTRDYDPLNPPPPPPPPSDPDPRVSISAGSGVTEGAAASFTLTANPTPGTALSVTVTITATGAYGVATGTRTVTIPTSGTETFTVSTTADDSDEPDGTVTATVVDGADYDLGATSAATVAVSDDDLASVHPRAQYADLITRIKTDMQNPNYRGEVHDLKRALKTLGVPEYAGYRGGEVGVQEAINRRTMPRDNPHWEGISDAVAYAHTYFAANPK